MTLTLETGGREIPIRRHGLKCTSHAGLPGACPYDDFKDPVFVHQESIRDFLVGTPAPRQAALR